MIQNYLTALVVMSVLTVLWLYIQRRWQRHFPKQGSADGDALANRIGCQGCTCDKSQCQQHTQKPTTRETSENAPARF
jgi:hypothetical protein